MINLNQLRAFYQTAKCQNVSVAARQLFVSQPAVTAQIKLFEDSCGLKLFKKKGRNLYLTDEGKTLFNYARKIFEYEKKIEDAVDQMKELKTGSLRLGSARTYARYFMPFLLTGFRDAYPDIKIHFDEGSSQEMIHSLIDLKNEVVIIAKADDNPNIEFVPFSREELVLILPPNHHLANKDSLNFEEVAEVPIIMKDAGSGTRKLVDELFAKNNRTPNILMETGDAEIIKLLVQHGEGVSFLVKEAAAVELQEKKLVTVPLKKESIFLDVSIAYLKKQTLSPPAQAFLRSLENLGTKKMRFQGMGALMARMLADER
ncbi:MAG: LysR family transcriptional regulator [Deltaproteobacteria bacterium]|nr:LysR family transcriptional regulator [Deltaproteobacteria bacterium]